MELRNAVFFFVLETQNRKVLAALRAADFHNLIEMARYENP
jgi:hypothetical protein